MNLRDWNSGTAATKPYLNPVCRTINCTEVNCLNVFCGTINDEPVPINVKNYAGTATKSVQTTTTEGSLIPLSGSGSLSIPTNTLSVGDTYKISIGGNLTSILNETLTLRLRMGPLSSVTVGTILLQSLPVISAQPFTFECFFTVFSTGGFGVASCSLNMMHNQTLDAGNNSFSKSQSSINSLVFQTDDVNDINVTAQWGSNGANSITSFTVCFYKIF